MTLKRLKSLINKDSKLVVSNSYCYLENFPNVILEVIKASLSYVNEEVKKEKTRIFIGLNTAKQYKNYKYYQALKVRLNSLPNENVCLLEGNRFPTGLLELVKNTLKTNKFDLYEVIDKRVRPEGYLTLRWHNRPSPLRYYQEEMLELADKHERGIFEASIGSGKSLVFTHIIKQKEVNTLVIVPSLALLEQTYRNLYMQFGPRNVQIIKSTTVSSSKKLKPIRIVGIQTLSALKKKNKVNKVLEDIDMLIVDEIHHSAASSFYNLLDDLDHVYYKYGFSGTYTRNDSKSMDMYGFLSNVLYQYSPNKATKEGYLTPVDYKIFTIQGNPNTNYQKEYDNNYSLNKDFFEIIVKLIEDLPKDEQILILVEKKDKVGIKIHEILKKHNIDNVYISGDNKKEHINDCIEKFNELKIRCLIGTNVIGEGVDIRSTKHLIIANGGKSEIKLVQGIGRCVRLFENKDKAFVYDFYFKDTVHLERHLRKRINIFKKYFDGSVEFK